MKTKLLQGIPYFNASIVYETSFKFTFTFTFTNSIN